LCIPILFNDEHAFMLLEKLLDFVTKRKRPDAQVVEVNAASGEVFDRLLYCKVTGHYRDDCDIRRLWGFTDRRRRHECGSRFPFET